MVRGGLTQDTPSRIKRAHGHGKGKEGAAELRGNLNTRLKAQPEPAGNRPGAPSQPLLLQRSLVLVAVERCRFFVGSQGKV